MLDKQELLSLTINPETMRCLSTVTFCTFEELSLNIGLGSKCQSKHKARVSVPCPHLSANVPRTSLDDQEVGPAQEPASCGPTSLLL